MSPAYAIAIDLGGTLLRVGLVSEQGEAVHLRTQPVAGRRGNAQITTLLKDALVDAMRWAQAHAITPSGIGLAVPGIVDGHRCAIRFSANLDVHELPVAGIVSEVLDLPVAVENDVRAAAWGEWRWGAGRGTTQMLYVNAGTGIAAAVISRGSLYRGAHGGAGELGHVPIVSGGAPCRCGKRGCLETVAGGWGIVRRSRKEAPERFAMFPERADEMEISAEAVFEAARRGDPVAARIIAEAGFYLGRAVGSLVRVLDPDRVILGGGLLLESSPLVSPIRTAIQEVFFEFEVVPAVHLAELGGEAGLIGAASLVLPVEATPR